MMSEKIEVVKEIRFAVVMYGGVSLAIYINGVAQELLAMSRATAVQPDPANQDVFRFTVADDELDSVEKIYRDLGCLLADEDLLATVLATSSDEQSWRVILKEKLAGQESIKTVRFVVDIVSGSSAGGINGIYLAKALAGGQRLKALERLWIAEGSFSKLLCDEKSVTEDGHPLGLLSPTVPMSLLNSERIYFELLRAFDGMDEDDPPGTPFGDEVDLFVTMTDYWGTPVPIRLYDQLIHERRHRQNLHLRFKKDENLNEFGTDIYPFLAFAARATSSFPLAFEPMQLVTANQIVRQLKKTSPDPNFRHKEIPDNFWKHSFSPATVQNENGDNVEISWEKRVFVDGGALDNKPFGYAIEALAQKQSDVLVERKLIYVEPEPDSDDGLARALENQKPNVLANVLAQAMSLPRYETIREDLQRVLERNRLITRVNQLVSNARQDELEALRLSLGELPDMIEQHKKMRYRLIEKYGDENQEPDAQDIKWEKLELGEVAQQKGQIAYPYYRLRVSALSDDLARAVMRRLGFDEDSDYFIVIRDLVQFWRKKNYGRGEETAGKVAATPMEFLQNYDFNYRLRRLRFVLQQADRLLKVDQNLQDELEKTMNTADTVERGKPADLLIGEIEKRILQARFPLIEAEIYNRPNQIPEEVIRTPSETIRRSNKEKLRQTVRSFKKEINRLLRELNQDLRQIEPRSGLATEDRTADSTDLQTQVDAAAAKIGGKDLSLLLGKDIKRQGTQLDTGNDSVARTERVKEFLANNKDIQADLDAIGKTLEQIYNDESGDSIFGRARKKARAIFEPEASELIEQQNVQRRLAVDESDVLYQAVRAYLRHFYDNFDAYDQIIFPVTYETPVGEAVTVDVARISPLDAPGLINEEEEKKRAKPYQARRKVAGGAFMAFGAFFKEEWRANDVMWGRLDAVERLVSIVLPKTESLANHNIRREIIEEAQEIILQAEPLVESAYHKSLQTASWPDKRPRVAFVRVEYNIERNLLTPETLAETARSFNIGSKILQPDKGSLTIKVTADVLVLLQALVTQIKTSQMPGLTDYQAFKRQIASLSSYQAAPAWVKQAGWASRFLDWLVGLANKGEKKFTNQTFHLILFICLIVTTAFLLLAGGIWLITTTFIYNGGAASWRYVIGVALVTGSFLYYFFLRRMYKKQINNLFTVGEKLTPAWNKFSEYATKFIESTLTKQ